MKPIYQVTVKDRKYHGLNETYLGQARSMKEAEKKAIMFAKKSRGFYRPYVSSIELLGDCRF